MRRLNFTTFYGSYGHIIEHNDKTANLEIIWNAAGPIKPYRKKYKSLHGAKIALARLTDSYELKEV